MSRKDAFRPAQQTIPYVSGDGDPLELRRNVEWKQALFRVEGTVEVTTTDGAAVPHPHHVANVLREGLLTQGNRELYGLRGQDYLVASRIMSAQPLVSDDGGLDPTTLGTYTMVAEVLVSAVYPWAPRGSLDVRVRAPGHSSTFQFEPRWDTGAASAASDDGTEALLATGSPDMVWTSEPEMIPVEEYDEIGGDPLPAYLPRATVHQSRLFTNPDDALRVDIDTNLPVMAALIQSFQRASGTRQPEDLINEVDFFGMPSWKEIPRELLDMRARRDFPGVTVGQTGAIPVLLARGGKWSARLTPADYEERTMFFDVEGPSNGQGRVRVILFHPLRPQGTVGTEIRSSVQLGGGGQGQGQGNG